MYRYLGRFFRFAFIAAVAVVARPTLPASAQPTLFTIDIPTANSLVNNGRMVNIGGWTAGSRVDAYLDGPAGVGEGIGSTRVDRPRPDVRGLTGRPDSGFDFTWQPMELSAGPHTLYVYSLIDGGWTLQTVPIIGEGNFIPVIPPILPHSE